MSPDESVVMVLGLVLAAVGWAGWAWRMLRLPWIAGRTAGRTMVLDLAPDAPPAFLLDHDRMAGGKTASPGRFDNRWMVFPQDFPSASFLLAQGIRRVVVVEPAGRTPAEDLVHVLLRYQQAGIEVLIESLDAPGHPRPAQLARPSWFRAMFYRALVLLRLRRNSAGGFGAAVPEATRGGGGFYG